MSLNTSQHRDVAEQADSLDRSSFVPLYYQLQEILKEQIESGIWAPGDALPSEPALARNFRVSRVVVRQALAILADDRQIVRKRGRGTFVADPKLESRAGGICRLIGSAAKSPISLRVLHAARASVEESVRERLQMDGLEALALTTALGARETPIAICQSFLRPEEAQWLESVARVGQHLPSDLRLPTGMQLAHSEVSIETSHCSKFEADSFNIRAGAPAFLVHCVEYRDDQGQPRPLEFARVVYRADVVQFHLELSPEGRSSEVAATWAVSGEPALSAHER
jgi:GntR family transcriptional regulator